MFILISNVILTIITINENNKKVKKIRKKKIKWTKENWFQSQHIGIKTWTELNFIKTSLIGFTVQVTVVESKYITLEMVAIYYGHVLPYNK